jgi:inner membrane protein
MDNLSHSLVGVALARSAAPWFPRLRGPMVAAVVANNLPDIDHAWLELFEDPRLAYLLHHRGHTHTLALALPQALGTAMLARMVDRQAGWRPLVAVSLVGVGLHLFFDYLNNYGLPPFWPLHPQRYQGDTLFILDPYLWAILFPVAVLGGGARLQAAGVLALSAIGVTVAQTASLTATALWTVFAALQAWVWWRPRAVVWAWGWVGAWLSVSGLASARVRTMLDQEWATHFPDEQLLDASIMPLPARPWCLLAVTTSDTGGALSARTYALRAARVSLVPFLDASRSCVLIDGPRTLDLEPVAATSPDIHWEGEWTRPTRALQDLIDDPDGGCRARQFLQVMRAPFWTDTLLGDLRYDFQEELSFAEITREGPCLGAVDFVSPTLSVLLRPDEGAAAD